MHKIFQLVDPNRSVQILGIKLVGFNAENGRKVLFSIGFLVFVWAVGRCLKWVTGRWGRAKRGKNEQRAFWIRQAVSIAVTLFNTVGLLSIWFDNPARLATAIGLVTAGLAFALQKVVTALAGYLVILRGKTFNVGDRITMGGIRGDVIGLNFLQTVIMEMGQPPEVQAADPAMWVQARQYSGRIVTVSNAKVSKNPFTTTLAISHSYGKRCICQYRTRLTANARSRSCSMPSANMSRTSLSLVSLLSPNSASLLRQGGSLSPVHF